MDTAPNFFEQLIRFLMVLFGTFPSQETTTPANCVYEDYDRVVLEQRIDELDNLLSDSEYSLADVSFNIFDIGVSFRKSDGGIVGIREFQLNCDEADIALDTLFDDSWFNSMYSIYVLGEKRRCIYEDIVLTEHKATYKERAYTLRYYYEPLSDISVRTVSLAFPSSNEVAFNAIIREFYPQLVTCNVTP